MNFKQILLILALTSGSFSFAMKQLELFNLESFTFINDSNVEYKPAARFQAPLASDLANADGRILFPAAHSRLQSSTIIPVLLATAKEPVASSQQDPKTNAVSLAEKPKISEYDSSSAVNLLATLKEQINNDNKKQAENAVQLNKSVDSALINSSTIKKESANISASDVHGLLPIKGHARKQHRWSSQSATYKFIKQENLNRSSETEDEAKVEGAEILQPTKSRSRKARPWDQALITFVNKKFTPPGK